jgi:hypothetical protein
MRARQHRHYCGIDLHVKTLYVCILDFDSAVALRLPTLVFLTTTGRIRSIRLTGGALIVVGPRLDLRLTK